MSATSARCRSSPRPISYWRARLEPERLEPVEDTGRAQFMVIAAAMRFGGVSFREISFSILVRRGAQEGARLLLAFNTCRVFAFIERAVFSTPYLHGNVAVEVLPKGNTTGFRLERRGTVGFEGKLGARAGGQAVAAGWKGPVFLPWDGRGEERDRRVFVADVSGDTHTWDFDPAQDSLALQDVPGCELFRQLRESGFAGKRWSLRADAEHIKSKTVTAAVLG